MGPGRSTGSACDGSVLARVRLVTSPHLASYRTDRQKYSRCFELSTERVRTSNTFTNFPLVLMVNKHAKSLTSWLDPIDHDQKRLDPIALSK